MPYVQQYWGTSLSLFSFFETTESSHKATQCRAIMHILFLLYLVTFTFAPFFRDFFAAFCVLFLIFYYILDYKNSVLRNFDGKGYFLFLYVFLLLGVVFSQNVDESFNIVLLHTFTSLALPMVGMECARNMRELRNIIWALVVALILQGCNGIYQYITGFDLIFNTPIDSGRLTGSFSDYRIGNYIALTLIPALSVYLILRPHYKLKSLFITGALIAPSLFLMFFSYTRNAYITLVAAAFFATVLWRMFSWKFIVAVGIGFLGLLQLPAIRLSWDVIARDARWQLWEFAYAVFKEFPFLGAGIGQYKNTFISFDNATATQKEMILGHPHNIYLQFLCENGLVGLCLALVFLFGILWWGYKKLRMLIVQSSSSSTERNSEKNMYWQIGSMFWCGWGAFLVSGIVGHNFFQRWWLALVMTYLGIMIGILVQATRKQD